MHIPQTDSPMVAASGDRQSSKAGQSREKVNTSRVKEFDNMRAQVKDCILQRFCEYSCLCLCNHIPIIHSSGDAGVTFSSKERFPWTNMLGVAFRKGLSLVNWNKNHRHKKHGYPNGKWTPRHLAPAHLKEILESAGDYNTALCFQPWPEGMYVLLLILCSHEGVSMQTG